MSVGLLSALLGRGGGCTPQDRARTLPEEPRLRRDLSQITGQASGKIANPKTPARRSNAVRRLALAVGLALVWAPTLASAQEGTMVVQGGQPGVHVLVNGVDVDSASTPGQAIRVDVDRPLPVTFSIH